MKSKYLDQTMKDFQNMSEIVFQQILLVEDLLQDKFKEETAEKIINNKTLINEYDIKIKDSLVNSLLLFTPRAMNLRKIISIHELILYLERMGDFLVNIVSCLQKTNLSLPKFVDYKLSLGKMIINVKEMVKEAIYSFSYENEELAISTISKINTINEWHAENVESLPLLFQKERLSEQEISNIININNVSYSIDRLAHYATRIAEATIYLIQGKDTRHDIQSNIE